MRYVALLRAVNVAGTGKLPMAALRALVESLGYARVETYIASGNVVFDSRASEVSVIEKLEAALREQLGVDTKVLVRSAEDLAPLASAHAFADRGVTGNKMHVVFLSRAPTRAAVAKLDLSRAPGDELVVRGREIHWLAPNGVGGSKLTLPYFEKTLGVHATARNHNTVTKLYELARRG